MTTEVPCAGCRSCCRDYAVILAPEDEARLASYDFRETTINGMPVRILNMRSDGNCVHLGDGGCTIYEQRPYACRSYDCRKHYLILSRNERRQTKNQDIWKQARKRVDGLDAEDLADVPAYFDRAKAAMEQVAGPAGGKAA